MSKNEKQLSEKLLLDSLRTMGNRFFPVRIRVVETEKRRQEATSIRTADVIAEIAWNTKTFDFAVETRVQFNPKAIDDAVQQVTRVAQQLKVNPLLVTPYLSDQQLRNLESKQVSGIDLCGNGIIVVPDRLLIYRSGNPNKYPSSSPIRNVYRGTSALVTRSFLLCPEYETSQELLEAVTKRGGEVTLSTVSKVCSSLEDELIIERKRQGRKTRLRLLQPEKLLNCLVENYEAPVIRQSFTGKCDLDEQAFEALALEWSSDTTQRVVQTGASSVDQYATMAREPVRRYYCTDVTGILSRLCDTLRETDRFPTIQLLETVDPSVYFDVRDDMDASPLQVYLELDAGDKRERETAEQIRPLLLQDAGRSRGGE